MEYWKKTLTNLLRCHLLRYVMSCHRSATGDVLAGEFESDFDKFDQIIDIPEILDGDEDSVSEEGHEELEPCGSVPAAKCLEKSSTSSASGEGLDSVASDEEDGEVETALKILFSEDLPGSTSLPLTSALKGSRDKMGASPRNLSVRWAPDVYDPIPNSLSHSVKNKPRKSRKERDRDNKKSGKKGRKGNSSKGNAGKDKKQPHKHGGKPDRGYKSHNACNDSDDFDVGSPDYCGSSFLKKSVTKFHYSVAEAL